MENRICPVCNENQWETIYQSTQNQIMSGDQRICSGTLQKDICITCGTVANSKPFSKNDLTQLYGQDYELNTLGVEEHYFYTSHGPQARSQVFFEWLSPFLPDNFTTFLEIGCGEGNLLQRFVQANQYKEFTGIDGSKKATKLAQKKGLNTKNLLILGNEELPRSDVIMLVNVVEHIENIPLFINMLKQALNSNGRILFTLPIQDYGGYDIFFKEHVWHFTSTQFEIILRKNGLNIIHSDINHEINHGIGLFVCELERNKTKNGRLEIQYTDSIAQNFNYWLAQFKKFEDTLSDYKKKKIALFGAGEVTTLFLTFTKLGSYNIIACIDDTKPSGFVKHEIPVHNSQWLDNHSIDVVFLTINKKYNQIVRDKLVHLNVDIISVL